MARTKRKFTYNRSKEIIADFQRIHPFLHSHFAFLLQRFSWIFAFIALVIGNTSLVGTVLQTQFQNNSLQFVTTRPSAALAFILLGFGVLFFNTRKNIFLAGLVYFFTISTFTLIVLCLLSFSPYVQQIIYPYIPYFKPDALNYFFHMAPNASITILFLSIGLFLLQRPKTVTFGQFVTLVGILVLLPIDIGYLYGSDFIFSISTSTKLAVSTTVALNALSFAILFSRPHQGMMAGITGQTTGAYFARRFIFLAIAAPIILGWIVLFGYNLHWYNAQSRFLLFITTSILSFLVWAVFIARSLENLDIIRRRFQDNIIFLSEASRALSSSLNYTTTLRRIAELTVPYFADWCDIQMLMPDGSLKQVALATKDTRKKEQIGTLLRNRLLTDAIHSGVHLTLKSHKPQLYPRITDEMLQASIKNKKDLQQLLRLHIRSAIIIPITVHNKTVGAIQFVLSTSGRTYTQSDLQVAQELTSRAALAIENAQLYKNAQDAIKIRDEFISIASHELKTPLTSLKVYTEVLLKKFQKEDGKTAGYLQKMDQQITNLTNLIKDLLDVSRIQLGKLTFHFEKVHFGDLVKDVVSTFQLTTDHKIHLKGTSSHIITADRERLGQVIINLLTNAVKYSPQADTVNVTFTQTHDTVSVEVQDFGIGMDKKHIGKIFDRFYQVGSKKRANVGLGMGLYISKEIVVRHGGSIFVQSAKGKGSTFLVTLPTRLPKPPEKM